MGRFTVASRAVAWERVAALLALASPALLVIDMALSTLDPGGGMFLVRLTTTGNAVYGGLVAAATLVAMRAALRQGRPPGRLLVVALALAVMFAALEPARLVPLLVSLGLVLSVQGHLAAGRPSESGLLDVFVAGVAGLGLLALLLFSVFETDGTEVVLRVRHPDSWWSFVLVDSDQGATGGSTVGYAERPLGGVATVQLTLYYGELGARPAVEGAGARTLRIDTTEVDLWLGPVVDESY